MSGDMRLTYDGLLVEPLPSGNVRYRVRVEGNKRRRITLPVGPDHAEFHQIYRAARAGVRLALSEASTDQEATDGTLEWLFRGYLSWLNAQVTAGDASRLTLKERENLSKFILQQTSQSGKSTGRVYAGLPFTIPEQELIALRDRMASTPGKARNVFKTLRAMYVWGVEHGHCSTNPAAAIRVTYRTGGGAVPWSLDDLKTYRATHKPGTMAHLTLTLFMFSACRISDAYRLGRDHEEDYNGRLWLAWQPQKRGSKFVRIPVMAPLETAISAQKVVGKTYLLTERGKPFASAEGLRNRFKKWCVEAGLPDRSSHGIRKAAGHLLALNGATQYAIMAVHGHANAATSQVYTESVERMKLGETALDCLAEMSW